jgi:hypothetical protein
LDALCREHGAYSKIPPAAWAEYDRAIEQWKSDLRNDVLVIDDTSTATGASREVLQMRAPRNR